VTRAPKYRVLVTDAHTTSALAIVRSLGAARMSVTTAGEAGRFNLASHSRHASRAITLASAEQNPVAYAEAVIAELERGSYDVLIPTTDTTTAILRRYRAQVERLVRVAIPSDAALDAAQDKQITIERARENGVAVPRTRIFRSLIELDREAEGLTYPCVVKPRFSRHWDGVGPMARGTAQYADSAQALRNICCTASHAPELLLVQEFISGGGVGVFALMDEGHVRTVFAHRRLREANPTGGRASLAESIPPDERFVTPALRLLRALRWTGVAMVEFKDPGAPAPPVVMEINGRFWGSLPLAIAAGVDFPLLLVQQVMGVAMTIPPMYAHGVRCRHLKSDLSYLAAAMKGRPSHWTGPFPGRLEAAAAIAPWPGRWHSYNLRPTDPWPAIREAVDFVRREVRTHSRPRASTVKPAAQHP
jgi:predicted ATP-grasp superfamily ATP-dependent carboligase